LRASRNSDESTKKHFGYSFVSAFEKPEEPKNPVKPGWAFF